MRRLETWIAIHSSFFAFFDRDVENWLITELRFPVSPLNKTLIWIISVVEQNIDYYD